MSLVKSKQRVADHGEVFTPEWMVDSILHLIRGVVARLDAKILESGLDGYESIESRVRPLEVTVNSDYDA